MDSIFNLSVIVAAVDNLTGPVREMARRMGDLDRVAERGRAMQDWGTRMSIAGAMTQGAASQMMRAIRGPIEAAAQFEQSMAAVRAVTANITTEEFEALTAQARELGATTAFSASQAAEGMGFLARAGFSANQQMAAMPSMLALARAGAVDLGTTADIASNILSGFGLDAAEMTRVADVMVATFTTANTDIPMLGDTMRYIAPVARAAGMSLEESAAMAGLLGNAGIQASQAGTTLRAMLQRLAAPTTEAAAVLQSLGISVADQNGDMRSMVTILGEVGNAIGDLGTQRQLDIIGTVFGVEAAAGAAELLSQGQAIGDYVDQLMGSQGRAAQVAAEMGNNFRGAQTEFASAVEGLNIALGTILLPMLTELAHWATGVVQAFMGWAEAHPTLAGIAMRVALVGTGILAVVAPILSVVGSFATMAGVGLQAIAGIGTGLVWLWPKFTMAIGAIRTFGTGLVWLWPKFTMAIGAIRTFGTALAITAVNRIPVFLSGLWALGAAAAGRVVAGLRAAAVAARAFGLALMANPIGLVVAAIAAAALLVWYYWEPIAEFFTGLWSDVQGSFEGFSSFVTGWWSRVMGWLGQGLDWASWLMPLRWLDLIPGFSWAGIIEGVLDWADWVTSLSWSEFVDLLTWENLLTGLNWASWVFPLRWLDFIPGFNWSAILGTALDWAAWVPTLTWSGVIASALSWADWVPALDWSAVIGTFTWDNALTALNWASWVLPLRWLDFIPGFSWSAILGAALDWAAWVPTLTWSGVIASVLSWADWVPALDWSAVIGAFTWDNALTALNWASWVLPLRWLDFVPGFNWSAILGTALDWAAWVPTLTWSGVIASALSWADWVPALDWSAVIGTFTWDNALTALNWASWVLPLRWLDFIPGFSWSAILGAALDWAAWVPTLTWSGVIASVLSWADWVPALDWSAVIGAFTWDNALTALNWASWVLPLRWLDFVPGFNWSAILGAALDWAAFVPTIAWSSFVPSFDLSSAITGAFSWLTWISPLNWLDYIPTFSWASVLPAMPALDWSAVATAMQAPIEAAFAGITVIWDGLRALFAWSPIETIRTAFGGIGETVSGLISGAADMAGAAWNRLTTVFSSGDAAEMAIRDPASLERAQVAVEALAAALERLSVLSLAPVQGGLEAVTAAAAAAIAQAGGIPAAAEAAIRSARAVLQGISFRSHGIAFMRTLAEGIRAGAAQAIEATRETVQAMRDHLPHSPAKVGPLSDLDRVRFSETVAGAVRPAPAIAAVHRMTAGMAAALTGATLSLPALAAQAPAIGGANLPVFQAAAALPRVGLDAPARAAASGAAPAAASAEGGPRVEINFNPTITMTGGAAVGGDGFQSREQMQELLRSMGHELVQLVQDELARQSRRDY